MADEQPVENKTMEQKVIAFCTSEHYQGAVELLRRSRTEIVSLIGETEHATVVNALTVELETALIQRFVIAVDKIRSGENLMEPPK